MKKSITVSLALIALILAMPACSTFDPAKPKDFWGIKSSFARSGDRMPPEADWTKVKYLDKPDDSLVFKELGVLTITETSGVWVDLDKVALAAKQLAGENGGNVVVQTKVSEELYSDGSTSYRYRIFKFKVGKL